MPTLTEQQYQKVVKRCQVLFEKKYKDYDTAWRILRIPSFVDQIFIKAMRIRTIQEKGQQVSDGIVTELIGIVNYSVLALIQLQLERAKEKRLHLTYKEVAARYDGVIEENVALLKQKNHDYNEAWRAMRVSSIVDIILMKLLRINEILDKKSLLASEGPGANFQDIINYAIFAQILLFPKQASSDDE